MTKQLKYSSCFCCQFIIKSLQLKSQLPENTIILTLYMHYFYLVVNIISLFICRHVLYLHVSRMLYLIYIELIPLSLKIILKRIYLSTYQQLSSPDQTSVFSCLMFFCDITIFCDCCELTLAGCQTPTQPLFNSPSATGQGKNIR